MSNEALTEWHIASNSIFISHSRPIIIFLIVKPPVGLVTLTLTFKAKVIPNSNAPNDSKVFADMSEVLLDHA